jgi:hypothetical protein
VCWPGVSYSAIESMTTESASAMILNFRNRVVVSVSWDNVSSQVATAASLPSSVGPPTSVHRTRSARYGYASLNRCLENASATVSGDGEVLISSPFDHRYARQTQRVGVVLSPSVGRANALVGLTS